MVAFVVELTTALQVDFVGNFVYGQRLSISPNQVEPPTTKSGTLQRSLFSLGNIQNEDFPHLN